MKPNAVIRGDPAASSLRRRSMARSRPATASTCTPAPASADTPSTSGPKPQPLSMTSAQKPAGGTPSAARACSWDGAS